MTTMRKITRRERLLYQFDKTMSKGPVALIAWLSFFSIFIIFTVTLIVSFTHIDDANRSFVELLWVGLMRTMDAGAVGGDTGSWQFLLAMLVITIGGILFFSILIGIFTTGLESKLKELRKGRSFVAEEGHIVILGWSPQIFMVISELAIANANQRDACITVLGEKDKIEMEDEIRSRVGATGNTRIVCRTGSPIDLTDLVIVNPQAARTIIILSPKEKDPDIQVIKTILALHNGSNDSTQSPPVVAALQDEKNVEVARLAGNENVHLVLAHDFIARIAAQTCRQSGLSVVYTELLDFGGDEIYFHEEPHLIGKTFAETLMAYADSAVIGIFHKDGRVQLNPPMETVLEQGDQIIAISEDDDTIRLSAVSHPQINEQAIHLASSAAPTPERTLILGWNHHAPAIINELGNYVAPGSALTVVADILDWDTDNVETSPYQNQTVSYQTGDINDRALLDSLEVKQYNHIIVLSYSDTMPVQQADAVTLVTLLHLRQIGNACNTPFSIVSEMLDTRNRALAEAARADDFIISDRLVSSLVAQIAENKWLEAVFQELFDADGSELYIKPVEEFVQPGNPVNFYTIVEAARRVGAVAIGYRLNKDAYSAAAAYGIKINPLKSEPITFSDQDRIIVLAEN